MLNKYVYLVDYSRQSVVDSALVKLDTVIFNQTWTPGFVPYEVSVQRIDSYKEHSYLRPMGVRSPYNADFIYSSFYLDTGITVLKPFDNTDRDYSGFFGSKQNEPFLKPIVLQFTDEGSRERHSIIQKNILKIKAYPYSVHLLKQLFNYREKFMPEDLKSQLSQFDENIKMTPLFKSFMEYFATLETHDKAFPEIKFQNYKGEYQNVGGEDAAYYLIVFWASWCGPCRQEIPDIKNLYEKFTSKGLSVTSISIDGNERNWHIALEEEKMPWQQLIAIDSTKAFIDLHYNIEAIPKAYLFNKKKELVKTFDDALVMAKNIHELFEKAE